MHGMQGRIRLIYPRSRTGVEDGMEGRISFIYPRSRTGV